MGLIHKLFRKVHQHGWLTFFTLALAAIAFSTYGFYYADAHTFKWIFIEKALVQAFADMPSDENAFHILGKLFWILAFTSAAVSLFLKEWSYRQLIEATKEKKHTAIVGIGKFSHVYIDMLKTSDTMIYNTNNSEKSDSLKAKGYSVENVNIDELETKLQIQKMEKVLINSGTDRDNINLSFKIIKTYMEEGYTHPLRLITRIENRELNALFGGSALFNDEQYKKSKIELKTYSFFEECAVKLFQDHSVDGDRSHVIDTNDAYAMIIAGDGVLAEKIIYEAAKMAHLPNQNILNIYLVCQKPDALYASLKKSFPNIDAIPTLKIHQYVLDSNTLEYFQDDIWHDKSVVNAVICYDEEDKNLEIIASLQSKTYLRQSPQNTKILFGVFNQGSITQTINKDVVNYQAFIPFGDAQDILTKDNVFDDQTNQIAKFVNYTYEGLIENDAFSPYKTLGDTSLIEEKWFHETSFSDKHSSLAQAKHIKMKLKIMGLQETPSQQDRTALLKNNRAVLDKVFGFTYEGNYPFPESFDNNLFNKMIRMEHNRWNAYHWLNGWEYEAYLNDDKALKEQKKKMKLHNCLLPLEAFKTAKFTKGTDASEAELIKLIEWDIYAFMYIPNYLAEAGYALESQDHA